MYENFKEIRSGGNGRSYDGRKRNDGNGGHRRGNLTKLSVL